MGVWKTKSTFKEYQKDVLKNGIIYTPYYYPNGKIMEKGQSRTDISSTERVWYYFGDWKYYNEDGKLLYIKKFVKGRKTDSLSFVGRIKR